MKAKQKSSKFQAPSTREAPSSKLQTIRAQVWQPGVWNFSGAWILMFGAFVFAFAFSTGCASQTVANCCRKELPACCAKSETVAAFTDKSLFQTESKWTTDTKKQITLAELKGRPQVVVMFFSSCQYACPLIVNDMKRIEAALAPELRARVGFTLVTFDTRRDTPEVLANYRATRQLPAKTWTLLRGESDDVLELVALLGVKYKEDANGQFAHSNVITVLNAQGEIVRQQIGLGQDIAGTVCELEKLLAN
jgi:protein SCO1/2